MATYGRNFDFRIPPLPEHRNGRHVAPAALLTGSGAGGGTAAGSKSGAGLIPIGAPVVWDTVAGLDAVGRQTVKLATIGQTPVVGQSGVLLYEYGPAAYANHDPFTTTYSDLDAAPLGAPVVVVKGTEAKFVLTNTVAGLFLGVSSYPGRVMVNGFGATATVAVGDYLVPGNGNDVDGYWQSQASATGAWAVITEVDTTRLEVTARMLF